MEYNKSLPIITDNRDVSRLKIILLLLLIAVLFVFATIPLYAYKILYAEQYYRLYNIHLYQYPEDYLENIYYLEQALKADFCNPLNALAVIENKKDWERYKNLFRVHTNLQLTRLYLGLGSKYDKRHAYFYNAPWQQRTLKSLEIARQTYEYAKIYWKEALKWNEKIEQSWVILEEVQKWEDESYRIREGLLDYNVIIDKQLARVESVTKAFREMNENTY